MPSGSHAPALPWQGAAVAADNLPLPHGAKWCAELSMNQEHRERLELSSPHYGCGILAAGRPVQSISSVGPEGLEPSPGGLRVRYAAASTLIPCFAALTRRIGAEGIEPSTRSL